MRNIEPYIYDYSIEKFSPIIQTELNKASSTYRILLSNNEVHNYVKQYVFTEDQKNQFINKYNEIRNQYFKNMSKFAKGICPYCSMGYTETIDHYLPKNNYPEFTFFPYNLIPACYTCNCKEKKNYIIRTGFHPYGEKEFPNKVTMKIEFKASIPIFTCSINRPIDEDEEDFYTQLDICNRYSERAQMEFESYRTQWRCFQKKVLRDHFVVESKSPLVWKKLFFTQLLNNFNDIYKCL